MPAKDRYHDAVVRALVKDGWTITGEQVFFEVRKRKLWIDIRAAKEAHNLVVLVEVKGFENIRSAVEYLANTIGKYILYLVVLRFNKIDIPLYLAVPSKAYNGILQEELGKLMLQEAEVKLIVFNPKTEEIVQWIP